MQGGFGTPDKEYKCTLCGSIMYQHGLPYPASNINNFPNLNETVLSSNGDEFEEHF
jgi:hypothetical protein